MVTFTTAALLLALERIVYVIVWRRPQLFGRVCEPLGRSPVEVLSGLFVLFKVIQALVFTAWCMAGPETVRPWDRPIACVAGLGLAGAGQPLNLAVFRRLGRTGVFYGTRFGYEVPWCTGFPFTVTAHPQYVGTVMTIWGFFLAMRYPEPDWIVLPILESAYYALGARLERQREMTAGEERPGAEERIEEPASRRRSTGTSP